MIKIERTMFSFFLQKFQVGYAFQWKMIFACGHLKSNVRWFKPFQILECTFFHVQTLSVCVSDGDRDGGEFHISQLLLSCFFNHISIIFHPQSFFTDTNTDHPAFIWCLIRKVPPTTNPDDDSIGDNFKEKL